MNLAIRPMAAADAGRVAALTTQLGYESTTEQIARRFAAIATRSENASHDVVLVADDRAGLGVVGWIHAHGVAILEGEPAVEIVGLVVDEACRGGGVGRMLLIAAEDWARERGYARMRVRSRIARERAHRFYHREGYETIKTSYTLEKEL